MNDIKRLKDQQRDKHPGFDSYLNCMTRALFSGLASFCLSKFNFLKRYQLHNFEINYNNKCFFFYYILLFSIFRLLFYAKTYTYKN